MYLLRHQLATIRSFVVYLALVDIRIQARLRLLLNRQLWHPQSQQTHRAEQLQRHKTTLLQLPLIGAGKREQSFGSWIMSHNLAATQQLTHL
ncbi:hypothetical protein CGH27_26365, partial [Vibrio parahaemolyticus]